MEVAFMLEETKMLILQAKVDFANVYLNTQWKQTGYVPGWMVRSVVTDNMLNQGVEMLIGEARNEDLLGRITPGKKPLDFVRIRVV